MKKQICLVICEGNVGINLVWCNVQNETVTGLPQNGKSIRLDIVEDKRTRPPYLIQRRDQNISEQLFFINVRDSTNKQLAASEDI